MIQRIQSLYLLLGFIILAVMFFLPFSTISYNGIVSSLYLSHFDAGGFSSVYRPILMLITWSMTTLSFLISIFLFKNRIKQMQFNVFVFLFNAALVFLLFWIPEKVANTISTDNISAIANFKSFGTIIPIISMFLLILANKAIKKDEIKVKMSNRIR